jgi:hypothetical protein
MWPLLAAVDGDRWCMIRWGVRPGIVVSLELRARAWRRGVLELVVSIMLGG